MVTNRPASVKALSCTMVCYTVNMGFIRRQQKLGLGQILVVSGFAVVLGYVLLKTFAATLNTPPNTLVFDSNRTGNYEVYRLSAAGAVTQLTNDSTYDSWWPKLSPDGQQLLFYRTPAGTHDTDYSKTSLWIANSDGSNPHQIVANGANGWVVQGHAEWSPDSSRIVMFAGNAGGGLLFTTDANGGNIKLVTTTAQASDTDPSWSPDGSRITYAFNGDIWIVAATGGTPTQVSTDSLVDYDPYYSPDGSQIAWLTNISANVWAIRAASPNGANLHDIINDGNINSKPAWSPDGSLVYFHRHSSDNAGGFFELWMINADGTGLTQLNAGTGSNEYPQAIPTNIPGDINGDGTVDVKDLAILAAHFRQTGDASQGDLDGSGTIDITDFSILALHWSN